MWYSVRFILRVLTRAGFSAMLFLWLVSQWRVISFDWTNGAQRVLGMSRAAAFAVEWRSGAGAPAYPYPVIPRNSPNMTLDIAGVTCWGSLDNGAIQLDYWLLCLLFLSAAIVTGWKTKRRSAEDHNPLEPETNPSKSTSPAEPLAENRAAASGANQ